MNSPMDLIDRSNRWYRLDNAAKIYPAISNRGRSSVFRLAVELKTVIDPMLLDEALNSILPRFPTFAVKMKSGLFWHFFEPNTDKPVISEEKGCPCRSIDMDETNGYLFRVCYYYKRISLEVFHSLTDGTGALTFLKALLHAYLLLIGCKIESDGNVPDIGIPPPNSETEDSFRDFYDPESKAKWAEEKAYQIAGTRMPFGAVSILHGKIQLDSYIKTVKASNATITEYSAALIIYSIYSILLKGKRGPYPVKVSVPVNLRRFFHSHTLRNFSSYVNAGLTFTRRQFTFEEILAAVSQQLREGIQPNKLLEKMSANVNAERKIYMRAVPLVIKDQLLRIAYKMYGESLFTCSLSNLGSIELPQSMKEHIENFEFVLGAPLINKLNCGICSFNGILTVTFTRTILEPDVEKAFFRHLTERGLEVTIESN